MFDELTKYQHNGHFFFQPGDDLEKKCTAPADSSGVYIVYGLARGRIELLYIGRSGRIDEDGVMENRQGGLRDKIVNGKHLNSGAAKIAWPAQMKRDSIEALDIYWYVTADDQHNDCPTKLKATLLKIYKEIHGRRPTWNKNG